LGVLPHRLGGFFRCVRCCRRRGIEQVFGGDFFHRFGRFFSRLGGAFVLGVEGRDQQPSDQDGNNSRRKALAAAKAIAGEER
jgi:hypothetical protein